MTGSEHPRVFPLLKLLKERFNEVPRFAIDAPDTSKSGWVYFSVNGRDFTVFCSIDGRYGLSEDTVNESDDPWTGYGEVADEILDTAAEAVDRLSSMLYAEKREKD